MSGPFSSPHLRVPRGFGTVLEGLAREVLRDQPEDIPAYAARYFETLLKQREESGVDPVEWAAGLEDRFHYDAFLHTGHQTSLDEEPESEATTSKEKSNESQTEDESSGSSEASCSSTQPHVSKKLDSAENTDEEDINTTGKFSISDEEGLSEIKSVAGRQSDEEINRDKKEVPTETTLDEVGQAETADKEIVDSNREENAKNDEAVESSPSSKLVDVDVCATELGGTQKTTEEGTVQENTDVEEDKDVTPQLEENAESLQSKQDFTQDSQQEDNDQAQKNNKGERTEAKASFGETNEVLVPSENNLDDSVMPKDSSVEMSFEDVSEHQNMSDSKDQLKFKTEKDKKESNSEGEEIHVTFAVTKEKVDTNNSNQNENEKEISVKGISSSDQPITKAEGEIQEHETDHKDTEEISERILPQNKEQDEMADASREDHTEMGKHEITDGAVEEKSSHAIKSNTSISGKEAEAETFDKDLPVPLENQQSPRTGQSQPENISDIKEVTSEEEEKSMKKTTDSKVHEEGKDRLDGSKKNTTASVNKVDKEECSRPQEEEDIMDIPLNDPEANRAAAKIQAGFRGHMTRKKMKPEDKTEGEEVSSTGDVLNSSQGVSETGRSGAVGRDDTSVPEQ